MKPPPFSYYDPTTLAEAVELLGTLDNARVLAGGQSLMPMMIMRYAFPDHVVDLNRIPDLAGVTLTGDRIRIGAMTRQRDMEDDPLLKQHLPIIGEALHFVGHRQTRNRGTLGGPLCHLDPAAELVAVCANLQAEIDIVSRRGRRRLTMAEFALGFMTPGVEGDEVVEAVRIPVPPAHEGYSFVELARRHGDFAIVAVAARLRLDAEGRIATAAVTLGGVDVVPVHLVEAEATLAGARPGQDVFAKAARAARSVDAQEDAQVPRWYRQQVSEVLVARSLAAAHARATVDSLSSGRMQ